MSDLASPSLLGTRPAGRRRSGRRRPFFHAAVLRLPALLAFGGTGSVALDQTIAAPRPAFLVVSAVLLAGSLWISLRLQTRPVNRWIVVAAAAASSALGAGPSWFSHNW